MSHPATTTLLDAALEHDLAGVSLYSRAAFLVPKEQETRWRWLKAKTEETWFWACELRAHSAALGPPPRASGPAAAQPAFTLADLATRVVAHETQGMRVFGELLLALPPAAVHLADTVRARISAMAAWIAEVPHSLVPEAANPDAARAELPAAAARVTESERAERALAALRAADGEAARADALAELLLAALRGDAGGAWFRESLERRGVHVRPVHFYEPIPDSRDLTDGLFQRQSQLPGIEMNDAGQQALLRDVFPRYRHEWERFPRSAGGDGAFWLGNPFFSGLDALVLYCLVRHLRPKHVLEVGSGYSSRVTALAARANGTTRLSCIEPFPDPALVRDRASLGELLVAKVQDVPLERFLELAAGDVLFIDSSHVAKIGSDVNYLFLEVLPRLRPGVVVHVHDIFLPREYPRRWVVEEQRFWNEQYFLQAFLMFNREFEVLFANAYMQARHRADVEALFASERGAPGGSFWMRRKG